VSHPVKVSRPFLAHDLCREDVGSFLSSSFGSEVAKPPSAEFQASLRISAPAGSPHPSGGALAARVSRLAVDIVGTLFRPHLEALSTGGRPSGPRREIRYRPSEFLWTVPRADRLTVVWLLEFPDTFDAALGRIVCTEFSDAGRKLSSAPPASFYELSAPPLELEGVSVTPGPNAVGYLALSILAYHVDSAAKLQRTIDRMVLLRTYMLYHIKAAKAALHVRMRARVDSLLQVLRRAHPPTDSEGLAKKLRKAANVALAIT
jgi:actin related protein 2/3 complex, subunit 2